MRERRSDGNLALRSLVGPSMLPRFFNLPTEIDCEIATQAGPKSGLKTPS